MREQMYEERRRQRELAERKRAQEELERLRAAEEAEARAKLLLEAQAAQRAAAEQVGAILSAELLCLFFLGIPVFLRALASVSLYHSVCAFTLVYPCGAGAPRRRSRTESVGGESCARGGCSSGR